MSIRSEIEVELLKYKNELLLAAAAAGAQIATASASWKTAVVAGVIAAVTRLFHPTPAPAAGK